MIPLRRGTKFERRHFFSFSDVAYEEETKTLRCWFQCKRLRKIARIPNDMLETDMHYSHGARSPQCVSYRNT